jgi:hypothetical protein
MSVMKSKKRDEQVKNQKEPARKKKRLIGGKSIKKQ